jgi:hypothetical protein
MAADRIFRPGIVAGMTFMDIQRDTVTDAEREAYDHSRANEEAWMVAHGVHLHRSCNWCHKADPLKHCSGCGSVAYCNADCQKNGWKQHKLTCARLENTPFVHTRPMFPGIGTMPHAFTHMGKLLEPAELGIFEAELAPGPILVDDTSFANFIVQYIAGKPFRDSNSFLDARNTIYDQTVADLNVVPSLLRIWPDKAYPVLEGRFGWHQQMVVGPFGPKGLTLDPEGEYWLGMSYLGYRRMTTLQWAWESFTTVHRWALDVALRGRPIPLLPEFTESQGRAFAIAVTFSVCAHWNIFPVRGIHRSVRGNYKLLTADLSAKIPEFLADPRTSISIEDFQDLREPPE